MDDQPFTYYQPPANFNSYSDLQYPPPSYDAEFVGSDENPFVDPNFVNTQPQDGTPNWSAPFTTPDASGVAFQRRGAVSGAVPEQSRPEAVSETAPRALRIDTSGGGNSGGQHHVQEASGNLASPLNIRPQHLDSATTPTFPPGPNTYDTTTAPTSYDMNHNHDRGTMSLSLTMPQTPTYFIGHPGAYDNRQLSQPQSALPGHPNQHHQISQDQHSQYAPSRSPQLHMHPLSAPPYGTSTPQGVLTIPYTPSSIASSSVRSVSPASTAATSAQPLDFSTYASPVGDYDMSSVPTHSPVARQPGPLSAGASLSPVIRSSAARSAPGHSASPIRRRANKQRLDDARRKEICTYARDRPKARQEDIALRYGVERSTISKILKNKDKWLSLDTHSSRKSMPAKHNSPVCVRPSKFPEIETELLKWVKECQENGTNITDTRIKTKAKECAAEIGLPEGKFKASSGWIENFKIRNNLTRRSQDDREVSPLHDGADPEHMDEDEEAPMPASQSTQVEDGDGYEAGQDSFNSLLSVATEPEVGMLPQDTSYSTFSDSMVSSQDLSLLSNTPLSSTASSFASSPSGALPQHMANSNLRARGHSHSIAMRAVGSSCTPSGSPQPGASPIQPLSPARLDMRFASTPTSASIPRFPSPLSASTSASGNPLVMIHNARHSPISQKHSRNPSDASGFSYDAPTDFSNGFGPPLFEPSSHQTLEALDTVLKYFQQPQSAGIASQLDCSTFAAVRARLAERLAQSLQPQRADMGAPGADA